MAINAAKETVPCLIPIWRVLLTLFSSDANGLDWVKIVNIQTGLDCVWITLV